MIFPEILGHCVWEGILQTFPPNKQGEFLTENRILKDCRNERFLFLSPFHMSTFFFLYIDVKISNCFVLFNNLWDFFPMAWRRVSKMEYFTHISKVFHDQEFKRKMWTETEKSSLGGNNSNVTDQLLLTATAVYTLSTRTKFATIFRVLLSFQCLLHQKHPTVSDTNRRGCLSSVLCKNQQNIEWSSELPYFIILHFCWRRKV